MDAQEYRRKAEHYLACAHQMTDPGDRTALLKMAAYWKQLAERAEQNEEEVTRQKEPSSKIDR
jgi:hypothetical protein